MPSPDQDFANRPRVFLSHSSVNKPFVRQFKASLDAEGFDCWVDEKQIEDIDLLSKEISDALETSEFFIAVHSTSFVASKWAQQELTAAIALQMSIKIKPVIVARLDDTPIPALLTGNLYADFRSDYNAGLRTVVRALTGRRDIRPVAAPGLPVDRAKLVAVLLGLDATSLTEVIVSINPRFAHDNQRLSVPERVQTLLGWGESTVGCGLNEIARAIIEKFPATKALIGFSFVSPSGTSATEGRGITARHNAFFSGRGNELARLHDALNNGGTVAVTQAVSGLGGIGKTALAVQYAHVYGAEYDHRLFCLADSPAALTAGFQSLAKELALPVPADASSEVVVDAVKHWLETTPGYLLILDNADFGATYTPKDLATFLPKPPIGHVLVTTRAQTMHGALNITRDHVLSLGVMDAGEAVTFLTQRVKGKGAMLTDDEADAAQELAEELGYLALALEQAAAYIAQKGLPFRTYLNLFRKRSVAQVEKATPETGNYEKTIATTWQISIEEVEHDCPASVALLTLSAYLPSDNIPVEVVYGAAHGAIPLIAEFFEGINENDEASERYAEILEPLTRYSLVMPDVANSTYSVHRLLQAVVQHAIDDTEMLQRKRNVITVIADAFPPPSFEHWRRCKRLLLCALTVNDYTQDQTLYNEDSARLLTNTAYYVHEQGEYVKSKYLFEKALSVYKSIFASPHQSIALAIINVAMTYKMQGKYSEAERLYSEGLSMQRNVLPELDVQISATLNSLAELYRTQGENSKAEPLYKEALRIIRNHPEHENTELPILLNNLGLLYKDSREFARAEPLLLEALEIATRALPTTYLTVAKCKHNLGFLYEAQNRYEKSIILYKDVEKIYRECLPYPHYNLSTVLNNLGTCYTAIKQFAKAEKYLVEALTICRDVFLYPHHEIATSLDSLAGLYINQGRYDKAEPLFKEAVEVALATLGKDHLFTNRIIMNYNLLLAQKETYILTTKSKANAKAGVVGIVEDFLAKKNR